jgi:hypothetical protein
MVTALPTISAQAAAPAPSTTLYFHSATGSYALDEASGAAAPGTAPAGATLTASAPTNGADAYASATVYPVGYRGTATRPMYSLPYGGAVSNACIDVFVSPDGAGVLSGEASMVFTLVRPDLTAVDLPAVGGSIDPDTAVARITALVTVPAGTEVPAGSSVQVAAADATDPTDFYYDSVDMPSSIGFNVAECGGVPAGGGGTPTPTPTATAPPVPTDPAAPAYATSTPPSSYGQAAGEPSIGFSEKTNKAWYQAGFDTMGISLASGTPQWELASGQIVSQLASGDPIGMVDRETGRIFDSQLAVACSLTEYSDDGVTWQPSQGCGLPHGPDHQTLGAGPFGPGGAPSGDYPHAVWYCSQANQAGLCALSSDGGTTFGVSSPTWVGECTGTHGHVMVAPDGTAYVPNQKCGGQIGVAVQTDGSNFTPWVLKKIPGSSGKTYIGDPSVGIDKTGRLYVGWQAADGTAHMSTSTDRGDHWTSVAIGNELGVKNIEFPSVIAADAGRAAFAFLGSTTGGNDQAANFPGTFSLYVSSTTDAGATWTTVDVTGADPVQRGQICMTGTTCLGNTRNLLDFMGITYDEQGRVLVAYPDGCVDACVTDPAANTWASRATLAYQTGGKRLLAAFDPQPPVATSTDYTGATAARSGTTLPLAARVTAADGRPVAAGTVTFTFAGGTMAAAVDAAGLARATLPAGAAGASQVTTIYSGSAGFAASRDNQLVDIYDVRLVPSAASSTPVSGAATAVTVTAVRTDTGATDGAWTGVPTLTSTDTHASGLSCVAAVAGRSSCGSVVFGDLGAQSLSAAAAGGYLSGSGPVTVQPTGIAFVLPPANARSGTSSTYTTAPRAGVDGAVLTGYRAVQTLTSSARADTVPAPQACAGEKCQFTVTFGKGGGTRTITVRDASTPARTATTTTKVTG